MINVEHGFVFQTVLNRTLDSVDRSDGLSRKFEDVSESMWEDRITDTYV